MCVDVEGGGGGAKSSKEFKFRRRKDMRLEQISTHVAGSKHPE